MWIEDRKQNPPAGLEGIKTHEDSPPATFLKPEDIMAALNAFDAYDLIRKPDSSPRSLDYATSALNIDNRDGVGIPKNILMASQPPQGQLSPMMSVKDSADMNYSDIPEEYRKFVPQGIYEHEYAHYKDPRLNPMAKNYGYLLRQALQGNIASREIPAMRAEDRYWDRTVKR